MFQVALILCLFIFVNSDSVDLCNNASVKDLKTNEVTNINKLCENGTCIMKGCSDLNSIFLFTNRTRTCKSLDELRILLGKPFELPNTIYKDYSKALQEISNKTLFGDFLHVSYTDPDMYSPNCTQSWLSERPGRSLNFLEDGSLILEQKHSANEYTFIKNGTFIMEFEVAYNKKLRKWVGPRKTISVLLTKFTEVSHINTQNIYHVAGMAISSFFLILVLLVYSVIMELSLINLMLMAHVSLLAVAFGVKAGQMAAEINRKISSTGCLIASPTWYFALLASFFWMNVMATDIFLGFCGKLKSPSRRRRGDFRRFCLYAIYAMGMPLLITVFAITVDVIYLPDYVNITRPNFFNCFPKPANTPYLYIPISILLLWNFLFFILTSFKIFYERYKFSKNLISTGSQCNQKNKDRFVVYIKLMMVTGANWTIDLVELVVDLPPWLSYTFNSNVFVGLAIFVIFVCNKKVFNQLRLGRRFNSRRADPLQGSTTKSSSYPSKKSSFDPIPLEAISQAQTQS